MRGEHIEENNEQTTRGLEYRTRQGAIRRQHNKLEAINAVLDEQDRQYNVGDFNDELLAAVYRNSSAHCQVAAYDLGLEDEAFVNEFRKEPDASVTEDESVSDMSDLEDNPANIENSKLHNEKAVNRISKIFKQVRLGRRALDVNALDLTRSLPQAA